MRKTISFLLISFLLSSCSFAEKIVEDPADREVLVPEEVKRVVCLNPDATRIMVALGAADTIVGVDSYSKSCAIIDYVYPDVKDAPDVGNPYQGTLSLEKLAELNPDLVLVGGSVPDIADTIQNELGIPSLCMYLNVKEIDDFLETIQIVGEGIGEEERAEELNSFIRGKMEDVSDITSDIPESERARVLTVGPPMTDDPLRVMLTQFALDTAGGINVAKSEDYRGGSPWGTVSLEQIAIWNPDIIMIHGMSLLNPEDIISNSDWQNLQAVEEGRVYKVFSAWVGYDTSMLVVSTLQMADIMYPDKFDFDFQEEAEEVCQMIYGVEGLPLYLESQFGISKI